MSRISAIVGHSTRSTPAVDTAPGQLYGPAQTSSSAASFACSWMNANRSSGRRPIQVGVVHDDPPPEPRRGALDPFAPPAAECLDQVLRLWVLPQLLRGGGGHVGVLPPQGQPRLRRAIARLLGRPAGTVTLHQE